MLDIQSLGGRLIDNLERVIVGKREALELIVVGLLCEGHVLIEDVPGVGKTMLARSLAKSLDCQFNRIQFTPDMLPSDITGVSIYNQKKGEFEFRPGPIIGQIILADEINRATPKTQAALLEAMEEHQVTVDGVTHVLPRPFMVLGDAKSHRVRGHVSAARSPAGSIPAARPPGLPGIHRRDQDPGQPAAQAPDRDADGR